VDLWVKGFNATVYGELVELKVTYCRKPLLPIEYLLTVAGPATDQQNGGDHPPTKDRVDQSLLLCDGPHFASLEVGLQVDVVTHNPIKDSGYVRFCGKKTHTAVLQELKGLRKKALE
jgi:hypothetical protein